MTELSPRARALFEAGRRSLQPSSEDQERVLLALSERIGAPVLGPDEAPRASAGATGLGWQGITAVVLGLAVAGAGVFELIRPASHAAPPAPSSTPLVNSAPEPIGSVDVSVPEAPAAASTDAASGALELPRASGHPKTLMPASDRLPEEVAMLSQAERDLHAAQYQDALRLLDEHRRKFPNGTLAQERSTARVQQLCGLGRVSDAQAELARPARQTVSLS